jgi:hypothetical protein
VKREGAARRTRRVLFEFLIVAASAGCSRESTDSSPDPREAPEERAAKRVVSFLEPAKPSGRDGEGSARISPDGPVRAGSWGMWAIEWTAGPSGLEPPGSIALQISPFWGWSPPQAERPGMAGYTTLTKPDGARFDWTRGQTPHSIAATLKEGRIAPGERVRFVYGDSTSGGAGNLARADLYAEEFEELLIRTDFEGDGVFALVKDQPTIRILPGEAQRLAVAVPSVVEPNTPFDVRVTALDARGSWTELPLGTIRIAARTMATAEDSTRALHELGVADKSDRIAMLPGVRISSGLYRIEASLQANDEWKHRPSDRESKETDRNLAGWSDVLLVESNSEFAGILWGDLHIHSALSDGTGSPEDLYRYAREVAGLDVACVTDHDAHGMEPLQGKNWERIRRATKDANVPGTFVTLLGYEWTSWTYGHRNVYYPGLEGEVFEFRWPESDSPQELWSKIAPFGGMTIPHHPAGGPVAVDWSIPSDEARESVVEICSIHGSSEAPGVEREIYDPIPGHHVRDAFALGHRLGNIASGDTHDGHPGKRTHGAPANGLVAFRGARRDRESIFECLRERRVYGTTGPRILLASEWGGNAPGSRLKEKPAGEIEVHVVAPEPVEVIEVIGEGGVVDRAYGGGRHVERRFAEGARANSPWRYVRVVLADGEAAWDSPWWTGSQR